MKQAGRCPATMPSFQGPNILPAHHQASPQSPYPGPSCSQDWCRLPTSSSSACCPRRLPATVSAATALGLPGGRWPISVPAHGGPQTAAPAGLVLNLQLSPERPGSSFPAQPGSSWLLGRLLVLGHRWGPGVSAPRTRAPVNAPAGAQTWSKRVPGKTVHTNHGLHRLRRVTVKTA